MFASITVWLGSMSSICTKQIVIHWILLSTVCLWNYLRQAISTLLITVVQSLNFRALFSNNVVGNLLRNIVHVTMSFVNLFNCI